MYETPHQQFDTKHKKSEPNLNTYQNSFSIFCIDMYSILYSIHYYGFSAYLVFGFGVRIYVFSRQTINIYGYDYIIFFLIVQ